MGKINPQSEEILELTKKLSLFETFCHIHFECMERYTKDLAKENDWAVWYTLRIYLKDETQCSNIKQIVFDHFQPGGYYRFISEIWIETTKTNVWKKLSDDEI